MFLSRAAKKSDEELMLLIQQGEEYAFTELYKRYSKLMVRYFFRMLWKDEGKAQDFLHDLFLKLIENPQRFNTEKKFSTWFYSVAHNMCKNEYRKQNFRNAVNNNLPRADMIESKVHEEMDHQTFVKALEITLTGWSEEDRSLFVFRHELEMTFAEIAAVLDCPEGTVKSRWFYLRKGLAEEFQGFHSVIK